MLDYGNFTFSLLKLTKTALEKWGNKSRYGGNPKTNSNRGREQICPVTIR